MAQDEQKYTIGEFTFETFHEYRDGQEDVRKIEIINKELDIQDPEVAVRLYNDIRMGKIVFKTIIGDQFFAHLADVVADKSVGLLEDKAVVEEAETQVHGQQIMAYVFIGVAVVSFAVFGIIELRDIIQTRNLTNLREQVAATTETTSDTAGDATGNTTVDSTEGSSVNGETSGGASSTDGETSEEIVEEEELIDESTLTILPEYADLVEQNPDMVGWLTIDDTEQLDLPVVQSDNEYYLTHAFDGSNNSNGTLFVDERSDIVNPTTNTIIYGHNMKSGNMFGELKKYLEEGYLEEHQIIHFNTIYEYRDYEIVAVGLDSVKYQDDSSFRYYDFIDATSEENFQEFVDTINSLAVYGDANSLTMDDEILTLSTCNSYTEDGRLFVVAKRVETTE